MSQREYTGVILAAGRGKRMFPFSEQYPKPMLPICNKPVIQHQIEVMRSLGINKVVILVGHKGFQIARALGDGSRFGVSIRYVEQTLTLGIAHAVGCLEPYVSTPFLLFLGDIFFIPRKMETMFALLEQQGGGAVLGTKEELDPAAIRLNYSVTLNPDGFVTRVIEKPRHTTNRMKGVGIYLFDLAIFDAIRRTPRTAMRDEYEITDSIQVLIGDDYPVRPANSVNEDINLTAPADLLHCNMLQMQLMREKCLLGVNASLHDRVHLDNCVVGDNVIVRHPISIQNSVIFDNSCIDNTSSFTNCIVTPENFVDCTLSRPYSSAVHAG
jgi:dTDP-glucose pyrophosphorylase